MVHEDENRRIRHKVRALLLPTPFAAHDPNAEADRERAVLRWLRIEPGQEDALHERCARDAWGVHVPRPPGAARPGTGGGGLLHPLSHEELGGGALGTKQVQAWWAWFDAARARWRFEDEASNEFEALWLSVHDEGWHDQVPGDPEYRDHTWFAHRTMASALVGARWGGEEAALLFGHYGPVQSFIAAARRTSDLWLGSYLVCDLAFAGVATVARRCGPDSVVFPHLGSLPLYQHLVAARKEGTSRQRARPLECLRPSTPNRFVAVVSWGQASEIAAALASAVSQRWSDYARDVRTGLGCSKDGLAGFETQIREHPVVDVVVQRWPSDPQVLRQMLSDNGRADEGSPAEPTAGTAETETGANAGEAYPAVFVRGRSMLAALRRVAPAGASDGDERDKCTQCGHREAMGGTGRGVQRGWWAELRVRVDASGTGRRIPSGRTGGDEAQTDEPETLDLRGKEMLCAVCLTKRFAHRFTVADQYGIRWQDRTQRVHLRFASVASIASAPFRQALLGGDGGDRSSFAQWRNEVDRAGREMNFSLPGNQVEGLGGLGRGEPLLEPDGTWLYARSYELETALRDHDEPELGDARPRLAKHLQQAQRLLCEMSAGRRPTAYYAVVVLDVDGMGTWIDGGHNKFPRVQGRARPVSASLHAEVSRRQGILASHTLPAVVRAHLGQLVYSGGDDVLAFLPLHTVWACLKQLDEAFKSPRGLGCNVTVSAGVAIADWKDPLQGVLTRARQAETRAKQGEGGDPESKGKNRVVVSVGRRSGRPGSVRLAWEHVLSIPKEVNRQWSRARTPPREDESTRSGAEGPRLLRPGALEVLRTEAVSLGSPDLAEALRHRLHELLCSATFGPLDAILNPQRCHVEDQSDEVPVDPDCATSPKLGPRDLKRVLELLTLMRFLVREHGGIDLADGVGSEEDEG